MTILRFPFYGLIWIAYIAFISTYAPLGADWLDWHAQRITNAILYLELNGYSSSYGFTIWSDCVDCSLDKTLWLDEIYLSTHGISLFPYILISYLFGYENLLNYSQFLDKITIFLTAVILSELSIIFFKQSNISKFIIGLMIFILFIANPWTYKMIIASWTEIYFILFFLSGVYLGIHNFKKLSIGFFFIAGLFNIVWSVALAIFYLLVSLLPQIIKENNIDLENFFPVLSNRTNGIEYFFAFFGSLILFLFTRFLAATNLDSASGSSILERIGISGIDIHNGSILGALQFLGGNRVTQCVYSYEDSVITSNLNLGIEAYNCVLSISSLLVVSLSSIIGVFFACKKFKLIKKLVTPLSFSLLFLLLLFQQSFSAHLMGYSYIFSIIFSIGVSYYFLNFLSTNQSMSIKYVFSAPILMGILILCIRVNMLTGANG